MNRTAVCSTSPHIALPCVYRVDWSRPFTWLREGLGDFGRNWMLSMSLGMVFSLFGYAVVSHFLYKSHLAMALTAGFLLIAPFLAIGFYGISCKLEDKAAGEDKAFACIRHNAASIGLFGLLLAFILSGWERLSAILVALMLRGDVVSLGPFSFSVLWAAEHWQFVAAYVGFGAVLAALVFAISVISLPMMMDRTVDVVTAVITSLTVVRQNFVPMLVWAAIIVALTALGIATLFVGMVVIFPLLGHASWHAYRDLVQAE
ncbi:putative membrane protein [Sulfuritortus calidifontis]|uniref:Putative membrane protein n=1 Tax=Sulfuritortus calidifontis TaxID=1914471 RepID=A0A4R3JXC9_9PROT|nr:DUF2189 domain-containing protein [Sulfuritortus calidifontis]TCS73048.1 putative membrane protein [Sulfuritortus calidifontis]